MRPLARSVLLLALAAAPAFAQSSFDTDPFAARFRERANFDLKFKVPEKGGFVRVEVPPGDGGRMSLVSEDVGEAEAAPGQLVTVVYQDITLKARKVRVDYKKKTVAAEGDVLLVQGKSRLSGARLDFDMNDRVGVLTDGKVDLEGGIHLAADLLSKVGPESFTMTRGTMTSCEGDDPAWAFQVARGRVTIDGYARLSGVVFRMGKVPLLYTPYLVWPARRDRASGFLIPGLGYNTARGGYLGLSYFWAIGRSADATLSADVYSKGFFGLGLEARLRPSEGTRAEGTYYTIWDPDEKRWRWQTRGTVTADDLAPGLRAVATWLDVSDLGFFQEFNRDFSLASTRSVKSQAFATWTKDPLALNLRLDREEALFGDSTVVTERRPALEARLRPTPLFGQRVFVEAEAQAGELNAERGAGQPSGRYGRFDLFPKVSVPLSSIPWLSLQADLGARLTQYGARLSSDGTTLLDESYTRRYVRAQLEVTGPTFSRIFDTGGFGFTKLKHVIEPRFDYDWLPAPEDVVKTPLFDEVDPIARTHTLRYALVQRLLGKGKSGSSREIASLEVARTYDFDLPGEGTPAGPSPLAPRQSPLESTLRVNTSPGLNFDARATYDTGARQITSASLTANLSSGERSLSLSLFDARPVGSEASAQLRFGGGIPIIPHLLRVDVVGNYDLSLGKMLESRTLATVEGSCFKVLVEYRDLRIGTVPSRDFRIALNLKNVGSFLDFTGSLSP